MTNTKTKNLFYKNAQFTQNQHPEAPKLQGLVAEAIFRRNPTLNSRVFDVESIDGEPAKWAINTRFEKNNMLFGNFISFTKGKKSQPSIRLDPDAEEIEISSLAFDEDKKDTHEIIDSILYFGISGNHLVILQSQALRTQALEKYINWLLRELTSLLSMNEEIHLMDQIPINKQKYFQDVKNITFSSPLLFKEEKVNEENKINSSNAALISTHSSNLVSNKEIQVGGNGAMFEALQAFCSKIGLTFGEFFNLSTKNNIENFLEKRLIGVTLSVKVDGNNKETHIDLMTKIANNLRHIDEQVNYKVDTKLGTLHKNELKLIKKQSIVYKEGLVDKEDLACKMQAWLTDLIITEQISPL